MKPSNDEEDFMLVMEVSLNQSMRNHKALVIKKILEIYKGLAMILNSNVWQARKHKKVETKF